MKLTRLCLLNIHQPFFLLLIMEKTKIFLVLRLLFWVGVPIVLLLLPATFFDNGRAICPSVLLLDLECPGCGITRACMHLIHFDFEGAFDYNMLSFIVFPILAYHWAKWFWEDYQKIRA